MGAAEVLEGLHFNLYRSGVLVETIGTFLLALTATFSTHTDAELAPLAYGFLWMALVFSFGYISGGMFNPAITVAAYLGVRPDSTEAADPLPQFPWHQAVLYVVAQFAGAIGAAVYMLFIVGFDFPVPEPETDAPLSVFRTFLGESVFTFVLASVFLHVATSVQRHNDFYGYAIGMAALAGAMSMMSGGALQRIGGVFNPAIAIGLIVIKCLVGVRCAAMAHVWVYPIAQLVGAVVAAVLFNSVTVALDGETDSSTTNVVDASASASKRNDDTADREVLPTAPITLDERPEDDGIALNSSSSGRRVDTHSKNKADATHEASHQPQHPPDLDVQYSSPMGRLRLTGKFKDTPPGMSASSSPAQATPVPPLASALPAAENTGARQQLSAVQPPSMKHLKPNGNATVDDSLEEDGAAASISIATALPAITIATSDMGASVELPASPRPAASSNSQASPKSPNLAMEEAAPRKATPSAVRRQRPDDVSPLDEMSDSESDSEKPKDSAAVNHHQGEEEEEGETR